MSQDLERVYTINLGKVLLSPDNQRAKRAINMIREFTQHHMKTEQVKIEEDVAHQVWSRGMRSPPRKIRVRMSRTDDGSVLVSRYEEGSEPVKPTEKVEDKAPEPETKVEDKAPEPETKVEDKAPEPETKVEDKAPEPETTKPSEKEEKKKE